MRPIFSHSLERELEDCDSVLERRRELQVYTLFDFKIPDLEQHLLQQHRGRLALLLAYEKVRARD